MRVLVAGWVNSPHVTRWVDMLLSLDYEVALVGHSAPGWPNSAPPEAVVTYDEYRLGRVPLARSLDLGRHLRASAARIRPDLIHAHWLAEYGWLGARARLHPLVSSAWGSDVLDAGWLVRRRARVAISGADLVLADSSALAEAATRLAPDVTPVELFHPGVDVDHYRPFDRDAARRSLGWVPEVPIVLSARALSPRYNPLTVIRAFARVRTKLPSARLVLKHPGDSVPRHVEDAIREHELSASVDVVGHLDEGAMPRIYQAANVVVSVPSSDSSPATAWEALACGRPLVVSDLPWARAELEHIKNAWLIPVDERALAEALTSVLTNEHLAARLAEGGRRLASRTMDRKERLRDLDERYRALVGR